MKRIALIIILLLGLCTLVFGATGVDQVADPASVDTIDPASVDGVTMAGGGPAICSDGDLIAYWALTSDATESCGTSAYNLVTNDAVCDTPIGYGSDGVDLDGAGDCLYTTNDFSFSDDTTVVVFFKCDECSETALASMYHSGTGDDREWMLGVTGGVNPWINVWLGIDNPVCGDDFEELQGDDTVTEDGATGYMAAFRHDDTDDYTYVDFWTTSDCVKEGTATDLTMPSDNSDCMLGQERFMVGARTSSTLVGFLFNGDIKNVMVFSGTDTKTDGELVTICNAYK